MFLIFFAVFMAFSKFRLQLYRMAEENDTESSGRNSILQASILRKMLTSLCQYDSLYMSLQINDTVKREAYGRTTGIQCAIVIMQQGMKAADGVQCARNTLKKIGSDLNIVSQVHSYEDDKDILTGSIVRSFDEALQNGWIKVFYHPILDTGTGKVSVFEGLARWIDPKEGMISPGQFIPVLSRYHLLHKLDL